MTKASKVAVTLLDVGQGSGTFVEIYDGTDIAATALLDLGSERAKDEAGGPSVDYIVKQLNTMTKPRIDFFSLSHSDTDHINLVQDLLAKYDPPGTTNPTKKILEIGTVIYGGPRVLYTKGKGKGRINVIQKVEEYQATGETKPQPLPANNSSYTQAKALFTFNEVEIYLLVGNHIAGEPRTIRTKIADKKWKTDGYSLNTYSLIFVVLFDNWRYIVTGDATGATISQANYVIDQHKLTFPNVAALTMPHHSSEPTTFGLVRSRTKRERETERVPDEAKKVIDTFAKSMQPKTLHASAEDVTNFGHPSAYVMSYFWGFVDKTSWYKDPVLSTDQHFFNAYFTEEDGYHIMLEEEDPTTKKKLPKKEILPPFDDWWSFATQHAIFTNRYYVRPQTYDPDEDLTATFPPDPGKVTAIPTSGAATSPPFAVAWRYTSDAATKKTSLERLENRKTGLVATPMMEMTRAEDAGEPGPVRAEPDAARPTRSMAARPPAHLALLTPRGGVAAVRPPRRTRPLDG